VDLFEEMLCFPLGNDKGYFVAIFTRRETLKVQDYEVVPYPSTEMNRNLLIVHVSHLFDPF
jgi:hypothetical protein